MKKKKVKINKEEKEIEKKKDGFQNNNQNQEINQQFSKNVEEHYNTYNNPLFSNNNGQEPLGAKKSETENPEMDEIDQFLSLLPSENQSLYRILYDEDLGSGSYSNVKKAKQINSGELFALKTYLMTTKENKQVNVNEIKKLSRLNHDNIIKLKFVLRNSQNPLDYSNFNCLMEFCEGSYYEGNIEDKIVNHLKKIGGTLKLNEFLHFARQILSAVDHVHRNGIAHMDIKLSNILITKSFEIKLCDFGSSISQEEKINSFPKITSQNMSPEMDYYFTNSDFSYLIKHDIWCIGIVFYNLLFLSDPLDLGKPQFLKQVQDIGYVPFDYNELNKRYSIYTDLILQLLQSTLSFSGQKRLNASQILSNKIFSLYDPKKLNNFEGSDLVSKQPINKDKQLYEECLTLYMAGDIEKCKQLCYSYIKLNGSDFKKSFNLYCIKIKIALYEEDYQSAINEIEYYRNNLAIFNYSEKIIISSLTLFLYCKTNSKPLIPEILQYLGDIFKNLIETQNNMISMENLLYLSHSLLLYYGFKNENPNVASVEIKKYLINFILNLFNQDSIPENYYFEIVQLGLLVSFLSNSKNSFQVSDKILLKVYSQKNNFCKTNPYEFLKILFNIGNHKLIANDYISANKIFDFAFNSISKLIEQRSDRVSNLIFKILLRLIECSIKINSIEVTFKLINEFNNNLCKFPLKLIEGHLFFAKCFFENGDCNLSRSQISLAIQKVSQIQENSTTIILKCIARINLSILFIYAGNIEPCITNYEEANNIYEHYKEYFKASLLQELSSNISLLRTIILVERRDQQSLEVLNQFIKNNISKLPVDLQFSSNCLQLYANIYFLKFELIDPLLKEMENEIPGDQISQENKKFYISLKAFLNIVTQNYETADKELNSILNLNLKPFERFLAIINKSIIHFFNRSYLESLQLLRNFLKEVNRYSQANSYKTNRFELKQLLSKMQFILPFANDHFSSEEENLLQNLLQE